MATIEPYDTKAGERYLVRYRTPDHKQTKKRGFRTKRDAKDFAATIETSKLNDTYIPPSAGRVTITEIGTRWLNARKAHLKTTSYDTERKEWLARVEPRWGPRKINSIKASELEAWVTELVDADLSAVVIHRAFGILRGIYGTAMRDRIVGISPLVGVKLPKRTQTQRHYLTMQQVILLASSCQTEEKSTLTRLLAFTGLRWGEATGLKVSDLDPARRRITVNRNVYRSGGEWHEGTPKTHERRTVPIPKTLLELILEQCEGREQSSYIFGNGLDPIGRPSADGWLHGAIVRAQATDKRFPRVTPHELRHTAASLAVSAGANVKAVQRMLGHASAAMTLDTYADLFDDDLDSVAVALNELECAQSVPKDEGGEVCPTCGTRLNTGE